MSHELLYTSAPQGLKPGSYGFCTVVATNGISKALQDRLESLSGYEHPFALTDKNARLNPVNYSYLVVTAANQRVHLLSRIADAGADYSGRSNKLAHHVALQPNELTAAGPGVMLETPGFSRTTYDGTPRVLPVGVSPPAAPRPPAICTAWAKITGDAGWAGVVADMTIRNPTRPITFIYDRGVEVLPLVVEALSLMPADRLWRTTFSTFFTKLPAGVDCQWRFVLEGTPAAEAARRNLQSPPITLASAGPVPQEGPLVTAARTGRLPQAAAAATPAAISGGRLITVGGGRESQPGGPAAEESGTYRLSAIPGKPGLALRARAEVDPGRRRKTPGLVGWGLMAAFLGLAVVGGAAAYFGMGRPVSIEEEATTVESPAEPEEENPAAALMAEEERKKVELQKPTETDIASKPPKETAGNKTDVAARPPARSENFNDLVKDVKQRGALLALPAKAEGVSSPGPRELCKIFTTDPLSFELSLLTHDRDSKGNSRIFLERLEPLNGNQRSWTAKARAVDSLDQEQLRDIGTFSLNGQSLLFEWTLGTPDWVAPQALKYCKLEIASGNNRLECSLSKPDKIESVKLDLSARNQMIRIGVPAGHLSPSLADFLRVDVELMATLKETPSIQILNINPRADAPQKVMIPFDAKHGKGDVELEFRILSDKSTGYQLSYRGFVFPRCVSAPKPGSPLQWDVTYLRADQAMKSAGETNLEKAIKDGFIKNDFNSKPMSTCFGLMSICRKEIEGQQALLGRLKRVAETYEKGPPESLRNEIAQAQRQKEFFEDGSRYCSEHGKWVEEMKTRFLELEQKVEIRFSAYLAYGDERVVLAESEPPPAHRGTSRVGNAESEQKPQKPNPRPDAAD